MSHPCTAKSSPLLVEGLQRFLLNLELLDHNLSLCTLCERQPHLLSLSMGVGNVLDLLLQAHSDVHDYHINILRLVKMGT